MKKGQGRRMNPTSGYIGSGNKTTFFTRRPKAPFTRIKEIYGEELERFKYRRLDSEIEFEPLSAEDRKKIRNNVKKQLRREQRKNIIAVIITLLIIVSIATLINYYFFEIREFFRSLNNHQGVTK